MSHKNISLMEINRVYTYSSDSLNIYLLVGGPHLKVKIYKAVSVDDYCCHRGSISSTIAESFKKEMRPYGLLFNYCTFRIKLLR